METKRKQSENQTHSPEKRVRAIAVFVPEEPTIDEDELKTPDHSLLLSKVPRIIDHIESALKQSQSPISPLEKFLNAMETIFGKQLDTEMIQFQQRKNSLWTCVKNELTKRSLVEPLLSLLENNSYEEVHKHVIYFLGMTATGTLETDPSLFVECFDKFTSIIGSNSSAVVPIMIWLHYTCNYEEFGQKLLVTRLNKCTREEDLESTLQVILYATESSGSPFQAFIGYGGINAILNVLSSTKSTKLRILALKCIQQFLYKDDICSLLSESGRLNHLTFILTHRSEIRDNETLQTFVVTILKRIITFLMKFSCWTPLICSGLLTELLYDISCFKQSFHNQLVNLLGKVKAKMDENIVSAHLYSMHPSWRFQAALVMVYSNFVGDPKRLKYKMMLEELIDIFMPVLLEKSSSNSHLSHVMSALKSLKLNKVKFNEETPRLLDETYKDWVNNERFHDVVFDVEESKVFAHRMVLVTKSEYFSIMFKEHHGLKESKPGIHTIELHGISQPIFLKLLTKLYCNEVQINSLEEALELLVSADRYLLQDLKDQCYSFIVSQISFENIETLFKLEDVYHTIIDNHKLQEACVDWLLQQKYDDDLHHLESLRHIISNVPNFEKKLVQSIKNSCQV